ncbi:MAG: hypothetical protein ACRD4O_11040, partial [Bryobacteraceae bacterium]
MPIWAPSRKSIIIWSVALFLVGVGLRLALLLLVNQAQELSRAEPVNIAISLATTGKYADAYGPGVGQTAHCAPFHPLLLSVLLRTFGINAHGELAMDVAASMASALAFALLPALAVVNGFPLVCGVLAGAAGAVLPFNFWPQTSGSFDAPFTAAALASLCILICCIRARGRFTKRSGAVLGIAVGLGCLLSPTMLPVIVGWMIVAVVERRRQLPRMIIFCGVSAACFMATLAPWAIRNYEALGSPIWTRSNFWLEMQVSNNDLMTADEERNVRMPEFALLHPYASAAERAKVKRLGEVAYMRTKRQEVLAWIATHKRRFVELTAEHFRLFWIPRMNRPLQTILEAALTILGLSGLVLLFRSRAASAWIFGVLVVLYPAVYYLIQVTPRYRLPLEPFLFLLAAYCLWRLTATISARRRMKTHTDT